MTSARIQPFCRKYNIKRVCYDGFRVCSRNKTEGDISLFVYKNIFCLLWKSHGVGFNKAIEELNIFFKVIDDVISHKNVKSFIKNEYKPNKVQSQLTNMLVYDIETFDTVKSVP